MAAGPYSQGIIAGNLVFTAGEIPTDPETGAIPISIEDQTELALKNLFGVLEEAGCGKDQVVSVNLYLSDMADFSTVNLIYAKYFAEPFPARTCIAASALPKGVKIEISAIAVKN